MEKRRFGHVSFILNNELITVGGYGLNDSEIFDGYKWRSGPSLPFRQLVYATVTIHNDVAIIIGGRKDYVGNYNKKIMKYMNGRFEIIEGFELSQGRYYHVALKL